MKSLKSKLMAAGAMLMISAVMLTSASFAWFTVSTAPEITTIDMTMTATKNLEIAKANGLTAPVEVTVQDGADETKWGAKITTFPAATVDYPATVPATNDKKAGEAEVSGKISTVTYTADGRTAGLIPATAPTTISTNGASDTNGGVAYYTADIKLGTNTFKSGAKVAAVYASWLRTNVAQTITATVDKSAMQVGGTGATDDQKTMVKIALLKGTVSGDTVTWTAIPEDGLVVDTTTGGANPDVDTPILVGVAVYVEGDSVMAKDIDTDMVITGIKVTFNGSVTSPTT